MHLFYIPETGSPVLSLDAEESWHATRVMRLRPGDTITFTDGKGGMGTGKLVEVSPKRSTVEITGMRNVVRDHPYLHIAMAPTKNIDRFEWFLEKATEIGVDEITPLVCDRSERAQVRLERLEKIVISATKQSLRAWKPLLNNPVRFGDFCQQDREGQQFIAWCSTGKEDLLHRLVIPGQAGTMLIGPEGDFSDEEVEMAKASRFKPVSLGNMRLRTETAGLVACHAFRLMNL